MNLVPLVDTFPCAERKDTALEGTPAPPPTPTVSEAGVAAPEEFDDTGMTTPEGFTWTPLGAGLGDAVTLPLAVPPAAAILRFLSNKIASRAGAGDPLLDGAFSILWACTAGAGTTCAPVPVVTGREGDNRIDCDWGDCAPECVLAFGLAFELESAAAAAPEADAKIEAALGNAPTPTPPEIIGIEVNERPVPDSEDETLLCCSRITEGGCRPVLLIGLGIWMGAIVLPSSMRTVLLGLALIFVFAFVAVDALALRVSG